MPSCASSWRRTGVASPLAKARTSRTTSRIPTRAAEVGSAVGLQRDPIPIPGRERRLMRAEAHPQGLLRLTLVEFLIRAIDAQVPIGERRADEVTVMGCR